MKRMSSAVAALVAVIAFSTAVCAESSSLKAARTLVAQEQMGRNLPSLALLAGKNTTTYAMIAEKLGNARANSALSEEINALLPRYQPKWDENLAAAYEQSFSEQELSSLVAEGRASKYVATVRERQAEIGHYMQASAAPVLTALVTDALKATVDKSMNQ
ncbi:hypothetical protein [Pseudomonas citrulli]|uniref:DUF2059 domain-containing protein n=1 Tax=Pseudomonas citrulli TaxID=3064347 RepID=A0ABT9C485_9PSED|nr:hypothetical protein [Pseudomonas sp. K18]MDO7898363.1 hypothetical protein [Pseudomonas sp. K18]